MKENICQKKLGGGEKHCNVTKGCPEYIQGDPLKLAPGKS